MPSWQESQAYQMSDYLTEEYNVFHMSILSITMSISSLHNGCKHGYISLVLDKDEYKALLNYHNAKFTEHKKPGNKLIIDKDSTAVQAGEVKAEFA